MTAPETLERLMQDERAAMTWTDPPYGVDYGGRGREKGRKAPGRILGDKGGPEFAAFLRAACRQIVAYTEGAIYICMASSRLPELQDAFVQAGGHPSTFIVWVKGHFALSRADYPRRYEPILYGWPRGRRRQWHGGRKQDDVWHCKQPSPRVRVHPTEKPVALIERAIGNNSAPGDRVLDPFAGSGSALLACHASGRVARLVELDPRWCDAIRRRWSDLGGTEVEI